MKTKTPLISGLATVGLAVAVWLIFKPSPPQATAPANPQRVILPEQPGNPTPPVATNPSPAEPASNRSELVLPPKEAKTDVAPKVAPPSPPAKKPKPPLQDPDARVAMGLVGADPGAEAYWLEAIFDSSLPDHERADLIEDLNEEGLSDRKRPGPEDLPLILNRLAIIEEIVLQADKFMLPHLAEAYTDLWNLAEITRGGGRPVR